MFWFRFDCKMKKPCLISRESTHYNMGQLTIRYLPPFHPNPKFNSMFFCLCMRTLIALHALCSAGVYYCLWVCRCIHECVYVCVCTALMRQNSICSTPVRLSLGEEPEAAQTHTLAYKSLLCSLSSSTHVHVYITQKYVMHVCDQGWWQRKRQTKYILNMHIWQMLSYQRGVCMYTVRADI